MKPFSKKRKFPARVWRDHRGKKKVVVPDRWQEGNRKLDRESNAVGLRTGNGLIVIDVDTKESKERLDKEPTVETANGYHYYIVNGPDLRNRTNIFNDKKYPVDIRGEGGFVFCEYSGRDSRIYYKRIGDVIDWKDLPKKWRKKLTEKVTAITNENIDGAELIEPDEAMLSPDEVRYLLTKIDPDSGYQTWWSVGRALFAWDAEKGLGLYKEWSKQSVDYDEGEIELKWRDASKGNQIGVGTLFHLANVTLDELEPNEEYKAPALQMELLPRVVRRRVTSVCLSMGLSPESGVAYALSLLSACVGAKTLDEWERAPILWGFTVGGSGMGKSGMVKKLSAPFIFEEARARDKYEKKKKKLQKEINALRTEAASYKRKQGDEQRLEVVSGRLEKMEEKLEELRGAPVMFINGTPQALVRNTLNRIDEDRAAYCEYTEAGEVVSLLQEAGKEQMRFLLLKGHDGDPYMNSTLTNGVLECQQPWIVVNAIGQPGIIAEIVEESKRKSDGLLARFQLVSIMEFAPRTGDGGEGEEEWAALIRRLYRAESFDNFGLTGEALTLLYRLQEESRIVAGGKEGIIPEYINKNIGTALRLATLFWIIEERSGPIDAEMLWRCHLLMLDFREAAIELYHKRVVDEALKKGELMTLEDHCTQQVVKWIDKHREKLPLSIRDFARGVYVQKNYQKSAGGERFKADLIKRVITKLGYGPDIVKNPS